MSRIPSPSAPSLFPVAAAQKEQLVGPRRGLLPSHAVVVCGIHRRQIPNQFDDGRYNLRTQLRGRSNLREIPGDVRAFGIELDATVAERARISSGRPVITGDALTVQLPKRPTRLISNIPFRVSFLNRLLDRYYHVLEEGDNATITILVPVFALQSSTRVSKYIERFSLRCDVIPRDIFPGLPLPLAIASFTKSRDRWLAGVAFFTEVAEQKRFPREIRDLMDRAQTNVWVAVIMRALEHLGGRGSVDEVTRYVSGYRPTRTEHWREAIRKHIRSFPREARGVYTLHAAA
jgi:site-specific DNA-methyltransferase (adenine-specific)